MSIGQEGSSSQSGHEPRNLTQVAQELATYRQVQIKTLIESRDKIQELESTIEKLQREIKWLQHQIDQLKQDQETLNERANSKRGIAKWFG